MFVTDVEWPGRREEIAMALEVLSTISPATTERYPRLKDAVHWLVDNTWWDDFDPANDIGKILRDKTEVSMIKAVVIPLLTVLDDLGPVRPDAEYLARPLWAVVAANAKTAHRLMTSDQSP